MFEPVEEAARVALVEHYSRRVRALRHVAEEARKDADEARERYFFRTYDTDDSKAAGAVLDDLLEREHRVREEAKEHGVTEDDMLEWGLVLSVESAYSGP